MKKLYPKNKQIIFSISYGNYLKSNGGTDKVILEHQNFFNIDGFSYFFIYPFKRRYFGIDIIAYSVILDGNEVAEYLSEKELFNYLKVLHNDKYIFNCFFVHHLMGTSVDSLMRLFKAIQIPVYLYLHDYYTCCPQYNLLKNDEKYCNPQSGKKCSDCKYNTQAESNRKKFNELFEELKTRLTIIAPSQKCAEIWKLFYPIYGSHVRVISHQIIRKYLKNDEPINSRLRIAFIGRQEYCKGWSIWKQIVDLTNKNNLCYDLFYFGTGTDQLLNVKNHQVMFKAGSTNAMIDALIKNKIDIVMLLSNWPETYSYTLYEAIAANCYVITNCSSGNIEQQVYRNKWGFVYSSERELKSLLLDEQELMAKVKKFRSCNGYFKDIQPNSQEIINLVKVRSNKQGFVSYKPKSTKILLRIIRLLKKLNNKIHGN